MLRFNYATALINKGSHFRSSQSHATFFFSSDKHLYLDSHAKHANGSPRPTVYWVFIINPDTCWLFFFYMDSREMISVGLDLHAGCWWNFWRAEAASLYLLTRIVSLKYELPSGMGEWHRSKLNIRCLLLSLYNKLFITVQTYQLMQNDCGCICCFWMCYFPMMREIYYHEIPGVCNTCFIHKMVQ